jgi:hypothetical protein
MCGNKKTGNQLTGWCHTNLWPEKGTLIGWISMGFILIRTKKRAIQTVEKMQ